jgi:hypothetical protein
MGHQAGNEMDVSAQPIELGNRDGAFTMPPGLGEPVALCSPDNIRVLIAALEGKAQSGRETRRSSSYLLQRTLSNPGVVKFFCPHLREGRSRDPAASRSMSSGADEM